MRVHFLDVGDERYGDCVLIEEGAIRILVDGAHPGDFRQRGTTPAIPVQIADLLGQDGAIEVDLLVVTHCHMDHIGCLPTLVAEGTLRARWALVADPDLGYPAVVVSDGTAAFQPVLDRVVAGLREEPRTGFRSDSECEQFLTDAMNLEQRYRQMLIDLEGGGTRVVRFLGSDDPSTAADLRELAEALRPTGLEILGPTQNHLLLCTDAIARTTGAARRAAGQAGSSDVSGGRSAASLYRLLAGTSGRVDAGLPDDVTQFMDRPGRGAALNNQSILLKFDAGDGAVLLTGDIQLAKPEVSGLDALMSEQLAAIQAAGPYVLVKLPHHASYNGFNERVMSVFPGTATYVVSTGRGDAGHPDQSVLALLQDHRSELQWGRTDKNGIVSADIAGGTVKLRPAMGRLNDATPNVAPDENSSATVLPPSLAAPVPAPPSKPSNKSEAPEPHPESFVEITARIPHVSTRVTITVEVEPGKSARIAASPARDLSTPNATKATVAWPALAGGRKLPPLVFATSLDRLASSVGPEAAQAAATAVTNAGQVLVDVQDLRNPFPEVMAACKPADIQGVVLIGGYDVLRSLVYDTLPPALRASLGHTTGDPDDFLVWSDQAYGDTDGDMLADVPVSRIPDGHSPDLLRRVLCAVPADTHPATYGLRNVARPFAQQVFNGLDGSGTLAVSEPSTASALGKAGFNAASVYLMLHGSDSDGTRYWGELAGGGLLEAFRSEDIPESCGGVVLAGCCWGALTVRSPANRHRANEEVQSLRPEESIALRFLLRGARAFVGCTGAHYSPIVLQPGGNLDYFGGPMHRAFWRRLQSGSAPATALFGAKLDYIRQMPHGRLTAEEQAIEYKILREFTCLGLGW